PAADGDPAVPARQFVVAAGSPDRVPADPDVPAGDAVPDLLRLLHDRRGPLATPDPAADRIRRAAEADPLGAARDYRLRGAALHLHRQRLSQMVHAQLRAAIAR